MKSFATLAIGNTFSSGPKGPVVGRIVANTSFLKALAAHGSFETHHFFVGDRDEGAAVERLVLESGWLEPQRVRVRNLLEIPGAIARGELSVLHYGSHLDRFLDLVALRDHFATRTLPVTGQIHSLSYPRSLADYLRWRVVTPGAQDAVFCSSEGGRRVLRTCLESVSEDLEGAGASPIATDCAFPVVPLGVDGDALAAGEGAALRAELGIAPNVVVLLVLARFSEADKMDLMPLLHAFRELSEAWGGPSPAPILVLAGARQGDDAPERLDLWSRTLGIGDRVVFLVDLPEERKPDLLAAADVFVSPCDNPQETFGVSVVEGLAAGLPCVVSDYDGYKELVDETVGRRVTTRQGGGVAALSEAGCLVHERPLHHLLAQGLQVDVPELVACLRELCLDADLRARLGRAAAARARERYAWSRVIPRYEATWRELAARPFAPQDRRPDRIPLTLDFSRVFAHYPTAWLEDDARVVRSAFGGRIAAAGGEFPRSGPLEDFFDEVLIVRALDRAVTPVPIGELVGDLRAGLAGRPDWVAEQMVAWLLKHDLLRLEPGEASSA